MESTLNKNTGKANSSTVSNANTTLSHSTSKTIFGSTKNSVYVIKEEKYEVKKLPLSEELIPAKHDNPISNPDRDDQKHLQRSETIGVCRGADEVCGDSMKPHEENSNASEIQLINAALNGMFKRRISEIESKAPLDFELQIKTHQEWIESLLKRNESIIKAMNSLNEELSECKVIPAIDADTRLKYYRDRDVLVKFIQDAFHNGNWRLDCLRLETVSLTEFLTSDTDTLSDDSESITTLFSRSTQTRNKSHFTKTTK